MFHIQKIVFSAPKNSGHNFDIIGAFKASEKYDETKKYSILFFDLWNQWDVVEILPLTKF